MGPARQRGTPGYSLTELLTVLGIMTAFLAIAVPNIIGAHETYMLKTSSSGMVSYLKLARMKAVANNLKYTAHLQPPADVRNQCKTADSDHQALAVYRDIADLTKAKVDNCFIFPKGIEVANAGSGSKPKSTFKANGMCENNTSQDKAAPNSYVVWSRDKKRCQLVCVNAMGAVNFNPVYEVPFGSPCSSVTDYNAGADTPCPAP